jgi:hypothetical protein
LTYAFFHASRKTLSNSKDSILLFWTNPEFNSSCPAPNKMKNWQKKAMFDSYEDASVYLGVWTPLLWRAIQLAFSFPAGSANESSHASF